MKIAILGANGMLGNGLVFQLSKYNFEIIPLTRKDVDVRVSQNVVDTIEKIKPDVVLNCVGLIKQSSEASNIALQVYLNAWFPHVLAMVCKAYKAKLIHFSTDCVFNGENSYYKETDPSDAYDLYGKSKYLGEVLYDNCFTMRTSIIGHSRSKLGLVDWFLSQKKVKGYANVIYSGLTTLEIGRILANYVIPRDMRGLYHISSDPISKYELLRLVNKVYGTDIKIEKDLKEVSDRSLNSTKFNQETGYTPRDWEKMIKKMYQYYLGFQEGLKATS